MQSSVPHFEGDALLDNPIWSSLITTHAPFAVGADIGRGLARRYPADVGPLSAVREPTPKAYADLATIMPLGDLAVLFLHSEREFPSNWQLLRSGALVQMVCLKPPDRPSLSEVIAPLEAADFPEMLALAARTEPGPFRDQTATLGKFFGIRIDGRLAAMAGQRLSPTGFVEVSAVCTHPDFRGRGYALALVSTVAREIHADGRIPFLTSYEANTGAIKVYQNAGFVFRRRFELAVVRPRATQV